MDESLALLFINESYVSYRKEWIKQNNDGASYYTGNSYPINDNMIQAHIKGKDTFGIKINKVSKFLAFDIDVYNDNIEATGLQAVRQLLSIIESVGVPREALSVFYSGSKGYHIDLFFKQPIKVEELANFHKAILILRAEEYGELKGVNIEARGCNGQGYKLPLGIHKKTGKRMWSLDIDTLQELPYVVPTVEPMEPSDFYLVKDEILDTRIVSEALREAYNADIKARVTKTAKIYTEAELEAMQARIEENKNTLSKVLEARSLLEKGTRNDVIFLLALYSNSTSRTTKEAKELIYEVMENTPAELFNDNSSLQWKNKEADKVVERVYSKNWRLKGFENSAKFSTEELEHILKSCKTLKEMSLYLCFMIYAKQFMSHDGVFYLAQTTIEKETGIEQANSSRMIKKLIKAGLVEVVEKGYYAIIEGNKIGIATSYKVPYLLENKDAPVGEIEIKKASTETIVETTVCSLTAERLLELVGKNKYYRVFKPVIK